MLSETAKILREIPKIDYGGCGISALVMVTQLKRKYGKVPKIIMCYPSYEEDNFTEFFMADHENIKNGNYRNVMFCDHIVLEYKGIFFDCNGRILEDYLDVCEFTVIFEEELIMLLNQATWNTDFKRSSAFKTIKKKLGINLKEILQ